jgi:hypothetical protein
MFYCLNRSLSYTALTNSVITTLFVLSWPPFNTAIFAVKDCAALLQKFISQLPSPIFVFLQPSTTLWHLSVDMAKSVTCLII